MAVSEMMELVATTKYMKKVVKQEGRLLTIVVVVVAPAVAITVAPATAGAAGVAVANHERGRR